jgi:gluconokinase
MNDEGQSATTARTNTFRIRVLVLMGVSGCGKSAVGEAVAKQWGADFQDADHWHTPEAVAKMAAGHPLTDGDRAPWLERLREKVIAATPPDGRTVLACSALRRCYRDALRTGQDGVRFVYLSGTKELIAARMARRQDHYMPAALLDSQFAALEAPGPDEAVTVSIDQPLEAVVQEVLNGIGSGPD